jgi:hypothetical protein
MHPPNSISPGDAEWACCALRDGLASILKSDLDGLFAAVDKVRAALAPSQKQLCMLLADNTIVKRIGHRHFAIAFRDFRRRRNLTAAKALTQKDVCKEYDLTRNVSPLVDGSDDEECEESEGEEDVSDGEPSGEPACKRRRSV